MKRKNNVINQLIYSNTILQDGKCHVYLSVFDFFLLVDKIISCGETAKYVKFNPFFESPKTSMIEFDEHMFYIEFAKSVTDEQKNEFINSCRGKEESFDNAKQHNMLCAENDITTFHAALENYRIYISNQFPKLVPEIKKRFNVNDDDLVLGNFCFEIYSN